MHENPDVHSVIGQSDELDRGTGTATSGGGLGKSTGLWSDHATRENMQANDIDGSIDETTEVEQRKKSTVKVDDELARPESDRSPLT